MRTLYATEDAAQSPHNAPDDVLPHGAKAGPWIVGAPLGHGGMGTVYGVVHESIGKRAALKVVHRRLCGGSTVQRILVEARVVNRVAHPNIVDIFETGTLDDGRPYIVMERLDGVSLGHHAYGAKLLPDRVIDILLQLCDALVSAHAAGIIHRDLKLDNVFVLANPEDPDRPRVKILDWGIAKEIDVDVHHTVEGLLVGTPQYLSPEQARGAELTPATDVYSLGVMAFELFLEQLPFEAETSAEIMTMHLRAAPPRPADLWPEIPSSLELLLFAMLAKQPDKRPSMETVARTLELVRDDLERRRGLPFPKPRPTRWSTAEPLSLETPARWRRGARRWQVAVGAAALTASTAMFMVSRGRESSAATVPAPMIMPALAVHATPTPTPLPPRVTTRTVTLPVTLPVAATAPAHHKIMPRPHRRRAPDPAPPRITLTVDPDGSIEAYR